jgi:hypothetical protein
MLEEDETEDAFNTTVLQKDTTRKLKPELR